MYCSCRHFQWLIWSHKSNEMAYLPMRSSPTTTPNKNEKDRSHLRRDGPFPGLEKVENLKQEFSSERSKEVKQEQKLEVEASREFVLNGDFELEFVSRKTTTTTTTMAQTTTTKTATTMATTAILLRLLASA